MTDPAAVDFLPAFFPTAWDQAVLDSIIQAYGLDFDAIARQSDPMRCDASLLPFLAFDRGGTLWSDAWPELKKRRYVRDLWIYKRLIGTPLGVEAHLNLADSAVIREVLPPANSFATPDGGAVAHEQLLALMPQLRLYHHWPEKLFPRTAAFADRGLADVMFAYPDQGEALGRYPVLYDPATGLETTLDVASINEVSAEVVLTHRGFGGTAFYADQGYADAAFAGTPLVEPPLVYSTQDPGMETVRRSPPLACWEMAGDLGTADRTFAMPDVGEIGSFDRIFLFDATRIASGAVNTITAAFYADWSWLGVPKYTEILTVAVPGTPAAVSYAAFTADASFALDADDQSSLALAVEAVAFSKRVGDRMLLDLAPTFAGTRAAPLPAMETI